MKSLLSLFRKPSPTEMARAELEEAQRELLRAQAVAEYTSAMVTCYRARVQRLQGAVGKELA